MLTPRTPAELALLLFNADTPTEEQLAKASEVIRMYDEAWNSDSGEEFGEVLRRLEAVYNHIVDLMDDDARRNLEKNIIRLDGMLP